MEMKETYEEAVAANKTARGIFVCVIVGSVITLAATGHFNSVASNNDNSLDCGDVQAAIGATIKKQSKCKANGDTPK